MNYLKIKVSFLLDEKRLNRTFLVSPKISLKMLGIAILSSFHSTLDHLFSMQDSKYSYVPDVYEINKSNEIYLSKTCLNDICLDKNDCFTMSYDLGKNYQFKIQLLEDTNIEIYKEIIEKAEIRCIDAQGYGIFDDDKNLLESFLKGKINRKKISSEILEILDNFDNKLDLEEINNNIVADIFYFEEEI